MDRDTGDVAAMRQLTMNAGVNECAIYSLAMVLNMQRDKVISYFPNYYHRTGKGGIRGLHFQEVVDFLLYFNYSCTLIEDRAFFEDGAEFAFTGDRFQNHINTSRGVLVGMNANGKCHATANDFGSICDPAINKLHMEYYQYWRIDRIRSS